MYHHLALVRSIALLTFCFICAVSNVEAGEPALFWKARRQNIDTIERYFVKRDRKETIIAPHISLAPSEGSDVSADTIYWTDAAAGAIVVAKRDGSEVRKLIVGLNKPVSVSVDPSNSRLYFADAGDNTISRAHIDGSQFTAIVQTVTSPKDVVFSPGLGRIFWVEDRKILSVLPDGSDQRTHHQVPEESNSTEHGIMNGLSIDEETQMIYWVEQLTYIVNPFNGAFAKEGRIYRMTFSEGTPEQIYQTAVSNYLGTISGLSLNSEQGKMFFVSGNGTTESLISTNLNGTGEQEIIAEITCASRHTFDELQSQFFWVGCGKLKRAEGDGSQEQDLNIADYSEIMSFTVERASGRVFLAVTSLDGAKEIRSYRFNGTDSTQMFVLPLADYEDIYSLAVDPLSSRLYFSTNQKIQRINLDGTELIDIATKPASISSIALDLRSEKLYWTEAFNLGGTDRIRLANLDGANVQDVLIGNLQFPQGLFFDAVKNQLYWDDAGVGLGILSPVRKIGRLQTNGSGLQVIHNNVSSANGITLDTVRRKLYWTEGNNIFVSKLKGTSVQLVTNNDAIVSNLVFITLPSARESGDYDGDGVGDLTVRRPSSATFFELLSDDALSIEERVRMVFLGQGGDIPLQADRDGDGKLDLAVWRPSAAQWIFCKSNLSGNCSGAQVSEFGKTGDIPIPGDFNGDGKEDRAVYREDSQSSLGYWRYRLSQSTAAVKVYQWGLNGDLPLSADFDGDGKTDLGVYRPGTGEWFVLLSQQNYSQAPSKIFYRQWGLSGDHPLPGDFDGDGQADLTVWRPVSGAWYTCYSVHNYDCSRGRAIQFGLSEDVPVVGHFGANGGMSLVVWRPKLNAVEGTWFVREVVTTDTSFYSEQWGLEGDIPLPLGAKNLLEILGVW